MSLDVTLRLDKPIKKNRGSGIFVRRGGMTIEVTRDEWNVMNPGKEPIKLQHENSEYETDVVFEYNITHNLADMADAAGLYQFLWRPEENDIVRAEQLIEPLRNGLHLLKMEPDRFKKFNPKNGWGDYEGLLKFVESYLDACYEYKSAKVEADR